MTRIATSRTRPCHNIRCSDVGRHGSQLLLTNSISQFPSATVGNGTLFAVFVATEKIARDVDFGGVATEAPRGS